MPQRALLLVLVVCSCPLSVGAQEGARSFELNPFEDLVVPEVELEDAASFAQALSSEGVASYENGDYETAARQLETSYRILPQADHLDVLGLALAALGHNRAAAERLDRFLEEGAMIHAGRRERAETALREVRQHFAMVSVASEPTGARLSLDEEPAGTTPLQLPLLVNVGAHQLRAQLDGYRDAMEELVVEGGSVVELLLHLEPLEAPRGRGIDIGMWTSIGITLACAALLVPSIVFAVVRTDELNEAAYPTSTMRRSAVAWRATSYAMAGTVGVATIGAVVLGVLR